MLAFGAVALNPVALSGALTVPASPGAITINNITSNGAHISWGASASVISGYEVSIDTGVASWQWVGNVLATDASGETASTTYTVRVRCFDSAGTRSLPVTASFTTLDQSVLVSAKVDASLVPLNRWITFEANARKVIFEGNNRVIQFEAF